MLVRLYPVWQVAVVINLPAARVKGTVMILKTFRKNTAGWTCHNFNKGQSIQPKTGQTARTAEFCLRKISNRFDNLVRKMAITAFPINKYLSSKNERVAT